EAAAAHQRHMTRRMRGARLLAAAAAFAALTAVSLGGSAGPDQRPPPPPPGRGRPVPPPDRPAIFRGEEALSRVYDSILDARFDQVDAERGRGGGRGPPGA